MKKQSSKFTRRTRGVVLGVIAVGVLLTGSLALTGTTPSSSLESVMATQKQPAQQNPKQETPTAPAVNSDVVPPAPSGDAPETMADTSAAPDGTGALPPVIAENDADLAKIAQPQLAAVGLKDIAAMSQGITVRLDGMRAVAGKGRTVGEISGPALSFSVTVANTTAEAISLNSLSVNLLAGTDSVPSVPLGAEDAAPVVVAPGAEAQAPFVFNVPPNLRNKVQVFVSLRADLPVAVFAGNQVGKKP